MGAPPVSVRGGSAVHLWARSELRRRWRALVALGVIAGGAVGLAGAAVAGSRQTATAYDRYRAATAAPDAIVFATQLGIADQDYSAVTALPEVLDAGTFNLAPIGVKEHAMGSLPPGDTHLYRTFSRPLLTSGRLPDPQRVDEVVINRKAAAVHGLGVGDRLTLVSSTDIADFFTGNPHPQGGPSVPATVVGVGDTPIDPAFFQDDPVVVVSGELLARFPEVPRQPNLVVRLRPGTDVGAFREKVTEVLGLPDVPIRDLAQDRKRVIRGTDLERTGLLLFAAATLLAGMVLVGQAITRTVYAMGESVPTLQALGLTSREVASGLMLPLGVTAAVGAAVTIAGAVAISGRFPVGLARRLEPDLGTHADWPVLLAGALTAALLVAAAAAVGVLRVNAATAAQPARRPGSLLLRGFRRWAPLPMAIGAGLALDAGRGRRSLPSRPALVGAVVGVVGVVGALGLVRGIDDALDHPARAGQVWDAAVYPGEEYHGDGLVDAIAEEPGVGGLAVMTLVPLDVDGAGLPSYLLDTVRGDLSFVVLEGRAPRGPDEAALGPSTAQALHKGIGDQVAVAGPNGQVELRVVGTALLAQTPHSEFDQGLWTTPPALRRVSPDVETNQLVVVRAAPGTSAETLAGRLDERFHDVETATLPQDVQVLRNVRTLPRGLALFLVVLGLAALGHALVTAVRRRRHDLAVLRAIGFRPAQNAACILSQAMTVAVVGALVGLPLGVAAGRLAWRWVADTTPLLYVGPVAAAAVALALPAALGIANVLAALPARQAARLRPAEVLRAE